MSRSYLPLIVFAGLVLAAGTIHGALTDRWSASTSVAEAARRLDAVPQTLADWHGEEAPLDTDNLQSLQSAGIKGHLSRRYRNIVTGERISLLIVCGRPGPISVHTPDICYGGAGYKAIGAQFQKKVTDDQGRALPVWAMQFESPPAVGSSRIEVCWTWNGGAGWSAPERPRMTFFRCPALYKLYVHRELPSQGVNENKDPSGSFLRTFLPEVEKILASGS